MSIPCDTDSPQSLPRLVPEGTVPVAAFEGTAEECGRQFGEFTLEKYPGYRRQVDNAHRWFTGLSSLETKLLESGVPHILDLYRGLTDVCGPPVAEAQAPTDGVWGCTSFGLSGSVTLDGHPISGGTRDVHMDKAYHHVVLRMRIKGAPAILMHTYPGNVLGLMGFWSTGMSIFSNSLYSSQEATDGLASATWGYLALAGSSAQEAAEIAEKHGLLGSGNCLVSDPDGISLSVEHNGGGVSFIPAREGIATHANHPEGEKTAPLEPEEYATMETNEAARGDSRYRMHGLWDLFHAERGRLTAQKAMYILSDHTHYPLGICAHMINDNPERGTTAAIIAEPSRGLLHATRSNPCSNWPVTFGL